MKLNGDSVGILCATVEGTGASNLSGRLGNYHYNVDREQSTHEVHDGLCNDPIDIGENQVENTAKQGMPLRVFEFEDAQDR